MKDAARNVEIINVPDYTPDDRRPMDNAIGYLAMWAHAANVYRYALICVGHDGDIYASYWRDHQAKLAGGRCDYAIMGQRDRETGEYSFHS